MVRKIILATLKFVRNITYVKYAQYKKTLPENHAEAKMIF